MTTLNVVTAAKPIRALRWLSRIFGCLVIVPLAPMDLTAEPLPHSVLIIDQSEPSSPWGHSFREAFRSSLTEALAEPIAIYVEILDLGRFAGPNYEELLRNYLREKYRDKPVGVIVTLGSAALKLFIPMREELWSGVPLVAAAVDDAAATQSNFPSEATGTILRLSVRNAVIAARSLVPGLKRIALVGDPFERQPYFGHFTQELQEFKGDLEFLDLLGKPMAELKVRLAVLPSDAAILYTAIYVDGAGVTYIPREALRAIAEVANRPIVINSDGQLGYGGTGGYVALADRVGQDAAQRALRILRGEAASDIPVTVGDFAIPIFDWRQLQRLGISESSLPAGSEVRFREPTAWERYSSQISLIAGTLLLQTTLIVVLFYERRRRRSAEATTHSAIGKLADMNRVATAGELTASIAHEVNQPLAAIVANANAGLRFLTNATPDLDEARAALKSVVSDGHRAGEVVGNVRAIFKKATEKKTPLDLNDLIQHVLGLVRGELEAQGILVQTGLSRPLPLVLGDSGQLQQVILNLVRNSADAMDSVSSRARVLRVNSAIHDPNAVLVSIEDSGTGIDPKDIDRIFESFFTTKSQGMGMGLSICRSIIEAHHGRLWASSGINHGAMFSIQLPAVRPGAEE